LCILGIVVNSKQHYPRDLSQSVVDQTIVLMYENSGAQEEPKQEQDVQRYCGKVYASSNATAATINFAENFIESSGGKCVSKTKNIDLNGSTSNLDQSTIPSHGTDTSFQSEAETTNTNLSQQGLDGSHSMGRNVKTEPGSEIINLSEQGLSGSHARDGTFEIEAETTNTNPSAQGLQDVTENTNLSQQGLDGSHSTERNVKTEPWSEIINPSVRGLHDVTENNNLSQQGLDGSHSTERNVKTEPGSEIINPSVRGLHDVTENNNLSEQGLDTENKNSNRSVQGFGLSNPNHYTGPDEHNDEFSDSEGLVAGPGGDGVDDRHHNDGESASTAKPSRCPLSANCLMCLGGEDEDDGSEGFLLNLCKGCLMGAVYLRLAQNKDHNDLPDMRIVSEEVRYRMDLPSQFANYIHLVDFLQETERKVAAKRTEMEEYIKETDAKRKEVEDSIAELEKTEQNLNTDIGCKTHDQEELDTNIAERRKELKSIEEQLEKCTNELAVVGKKLEEATEDHKEAEKKREKALRAVEEAGSKMLKLNKESEKKNSANEATQSISESRSVGAGSNTLPNIQQQIDLKKAELNSNLEALADVQKEIDQKIQTREALVKQLQTLKDAEEPGKSDLIEDSFTTQAGLLNDMLTEVLNDKIKHEEELVELREEKKTLLGAIESLTKKRDELPDLETKVALKSKQYKQLNEVCTTKEKLIADLEEKVAKTETTLATKERSKAILETGVENLKTELENVGTQVKQKKLELDGVEKTLDEKQITHSDLDTKIASLKKTLTEVRSEQAELAAEKLRLQQTYLIFKREAANKQKEYDELVEKISANKPNRNESRLQTSMSTASTSASSVTSSPTSCSTPLVQRNAGQGEPKAQRKLDLNSGNANLQHLKKELTEDEGQETQFEEDAEHTPETEENTPEAVDNLGDIKRAQIKRVMTKKKSLNDSIETDAEDEVHVIEKVTFDDVTNESSIDEAQLTLLVQGHGFFSKNVTYRHANRSALRSKLEKRGVKILRECSFWKALEDSVKFFPDGEAVTVDNLIDRTIEFLKNEEDNFQVS